MLNRLLLAATSLLFCHAIQAQSCCDNDNTTTLCWLSAADFCYSNAESCHEYALDGAFMEPGLRQKLISPANYGPNGTVSCNIELKQLQEPITVQTINTAGCDIIFTPAVTLDPSTLSSDGTQSFMPVAVLQAIKDWSVICPNNLVVVSQGEANLWGYSLENANVNPNTPQSGTSLSSIFNGPFGTISSFNQGGTFQGVFTGTPSTGYEILAKDALGRPTVALDLATNDLVAGDIGIYCTGPGDVTSGAGISTNNDVLVCNIFALACSLAEDVLTSEQVLEICPNETVTLPGGDVVSALGVYVDTLVASTGCDSIVKTTVSAKVIPTTTINSKHCNGDGFSMVVNGTTYNESNPNGQELMTTPKGCDSTVIIALAFNAHTAYTLDTVLCAGDFIPLHIGGMADAPGVYTDTLANFNGCDSVLTIHLDYHPRDSSFFVKQLCPGEVFSAGTQAYQAGETLVLPVPDQFGCDSFLVTKFVLYPAPIAQIDTAVEVTQSNFTPFTNSIQGDYLIKWLETTALSCGDCPNPVVLPNDGISPFTLTLTDNVGCVWVYPITVDYVCNSYIPNAFSPNGDGINDEFQLFSSGCPAQEFQFQIFDRWGGMVFSTDSPRIGWDGNHKGKPANQGVYIFTITIKEYGEIKRFKGEINLVR